MVVAAGAALPVLLLLTALSVYKLRGITPYGAQKQAGTGAGIDSEKTVSTPRWVKMLGITVVALLVLFVILHLTGNSPGGYAHSG